MVDETCYPHIYDEEALADAEIADDSWILFDMGVALFVGLCVLIGGLWLAVNLFHWK